MKVASTMLITALALSAVQAAPAPIMEERSESTTDAAAAEAPVEARKFPLTKAQGKIAKNLLKVLVASGSTAAAVDNAREGNGHPPGMRRSLPEDAEAEVDTRASHKHQIKIGTGIISVIGGGIATAANTWNLTHPPRSVDDEDEDVEARDDAEARAVDGAGRDGIDARDTTDAETDLEARRLTGNQIGGLAIAGGSVLAFGAGVGKGVYDRVHHKNRRSLEEDDEQLARDTAQDQIDYTPRELAEEDQEIAARMGKKAKWAAKIVGGTAASATIIGGGLTAALLPAHLREKQQAREAGADQHVARDLTEEDYALLARHAEGTQALIARSTEDDHVLAARSAEENAQAIIARYVEDEQALDARKLGGKSKFAIAAGGIVAAGLTGVGIGSVIKHYQEKNKGRSLDEQLSAREIEELETRMSGKAKFGLAVGGVVAAGATGVGLGSLVKHYQDKHKGRRDLEGEEQSELLAREQPSELEARGTAGRLAYATAGLVSTLGAGVGGAALYNHFHPKQRDISDEPLSEREELEARGGKTKAAVYAASIVGQLGIGAGGGALYEHFHHKQRDLDGEELSARDVQLYEACARDIEAVANELASRGYAVDARDVQSAQHELLARSLDDHIAADSLEARGHGLGTSAKVKLGAGLVAGATVLGGGIAAAVIHHKNKNKQRDLGPEELLDARDVAEVADSLEARGSGLGKSAKVKLGVGLLAGATVLGGGIAAAVVHHKNSKNKQRDLDGAFEEGELAARSPKVNWGRVAEGTVGTLAAGGITAALAYGFTHKGRRDYEELPERTSEELLERQIIELPERDLDEHVLPERALDEEELALERRLSGIGRLAASGASAIAGVGSVAGTTLLINHYRNKDRQHARPQARELPERAIDAVSEHDEPDQLVDERAKGWRHATTADRIAVGNGAMSIGGAAMGLAAAGITAYHKATAPRDLEEVHGRALESLPEHEQALLARKFGWKAASHADKLGVVNGVLGGVAGGLGAAAGTVYLVKNKNKRDEDEASLESRKFGWKAASHADKLGVVNGVLGGIAGGLGAAAGTVYLIKNHNRNKRALYEDISLDARDEDTALAAREFDISLDARDADSALLARKFGWKAASHADKLGVVNGVLGGIAGGLGAAAGTTYLIKNKGKRDVDPSADAAPFEERKFKFRHPGAATTGAALSFTGANIAAATGLTTLYNNVKGRDAEETTVLRDAEELQARRADEELEARKWSFKHRASAATAGAALGTVAATAGIVGGSIALYNQLHRRDAEELQARIDAEELAARDPKWTFNHRPSAATAGAALGTLAATAGIAGGGVALYNQLHRRDAAEELEARRDIDEELVARDPKWTFNHKASAATAGAALGTLAANIGIAGGAIALHNVIKSRGIDESEARRAFEDPEVRRAIEEELEARRRKAHMPSADTVGSMLGSFVGAASLTTGGVALHNALHPKNSRRDVYVIPETSLDGRGQVYEVFNDRDVAENEAFTSALPARRQAQDTYVF